MPVHTPGLAALLVAALASWTSVRALPATSSPPRLPGMQEDGTVLLPNQWSLRPLGRQVTLGDFPVNLAVHPGGRYVAVLHSGYGQHEIVIVDVRTAKAISRVSLEESFYGLAFSSDGTRLFASGAGFEVVHAFAFRKGFLSDPQEYPVRDPRQKGVVAGLAVAPDGKTIFTANLWGHSVSVLSLAEGAAVQDIPLQDAAAPDPVVSPPPADPDLDAASKRTRALDFIAGLDAPFPYTCVVDPARGRLYVSLWAQAQVAVVDLSTRQVTARWPTEDHPNELLLAHQGKFLFVANANRNTVSVLETATGRTLETMSSALYPGTEQAAMPPGSTPNSLALAPDEKTLYVANAGNNTVAVFDVTIPGRSRALGQLPVGWYPTSVRVTPDGQRLLVANGKGVMPRANRHGPQPGKSPPASVLEYIGGLHRGTLSIIELPDRRRAEHFMAVNTLETYRLSPLRAGLGIAASRPADSPIPATPGGPTPIKYCVYIIKENRTYDQVFGDLPEGNGDPSLCLFPERVTPNHHALARQFVLLDNFYVESEVSADGHEWTVGAYATDFVEKSWPLSYGHGPHGKFPYPSEGRFPIAAPSEGYIWDRCRQAGVSYRSYGEFVDAGPRPDAPATTRVKALEGHFDPWFPAWNMDVSDVKRAERFIAELERFEREGDMPRLQIMRLPNDHTYGTSVGKLTPTAMVAQNDLALGMVLAAITRSKFWPQTAVFVVEDDAQNGPDHVDAHRTVALVASPYARRGVVDSSMYSTTSMLRTMGLLLGLRPLSQFDAAARPMFNSFQAQPDLRPYEALSARVDLEERNTPAAWGAELSRGMDFTREDAADDLQLNEVVWRSVRGPLSPMPAPVRAAFVFPHRESEDDAKPATPRARGR